MGKLIAIDGLDGCGKETQSIILYNRLKEMNKNVYRVSFPNYDSKSSEVIKMYLNGEIGSNATKINPYLCSLMYAIDRGIQFYKTLFDVYNQKDSILICDRYISANIIHQGSKETDKDRRIELFDWIYDTEINRIGLPKEDITLILALSIEKNIEIIKNRQNKSGCSTDIHESNVGYLDSCYSTVNMAVEHLNSKGFNWKIIKCLDENGGILPITSISNLIWKEVCYLI